MLFNVDALRSKDKPIFIVEGEIDALSIMEVGGEAVGLGSTANYRSLVRMVEQIKPVQPLLIVLDNDESGEKTTKELVQALKERNIRHTTLELPKEYKDSGQMLATCKNDLREFVNASQNIEIKIVDLERQEYMKSSTANYLADFVNGIADSVNTPYISTGFKKLDKTLDGGLYEGDISSVRYRLWVRQHL